MNPVISSIIPEYVSLTDIYHSSQLHRYQELIALYEKTYNAKPKYIARAPGRVNLIGEHIDYSGYGVFPFALEQDTVILFSPNPSSKLLSINHKCYDQYPSIELPVDPKVPSKDAKAYYNYILAGYRSVLIPLNHQEPVGIDMLIEGNVPVAAGLSSSASIVVCSAVMTLIANNLRNQISVEDFTARVIEFERAMGPSVGGMDQTISVMGQKNKALFITFDPIKGETVQLPSNVVFVIGDSLTESKKLLTMGTRYNKRVCECRLALLLLKRGLKLKSENSIKNLAELQKFLGKTHEEMLTLVKEHLKIGGYSVKELEDILEASLSELFKDISNHDVVLQNNTEYYPFERAFHVYEESLRVLKFKEICQNTSLNDQDKIFSLGKLMDESHKGCRDLYDCSSDNLETFIGLAKKYKALGSRLTGAGWGGCAVSLLKSEDLEGFLLGMRKDFYADKDLMGKRIEDILFATKPGSGAGFMELKEKLE